MILLSGEAAIRLGCFLGVFVIMALWEVSSPRRQRSVLRSVRWPGNLGLTALNTLIVRVLTPTAAVGAAVLSADRGFGLLNQLSMPGWLSVAVSVLVLDLVIYLQHVLFHAVPVLWRIHRVHHADLDFDVTTGFRFHPAEIVLSMGIKLSVIVALGPPALAVLMFEVLLNATSMFNHGNIRIPSGLDRMLRWILVTPDMHRVHHSVNPSETNSNFGFNVPWWDRLLGTYLAQPAEGHESMTIGVNQFRTVHDLRLDQMLLQPFRGRIDSYPIGRRGSV